MSIRGFDLAQARYDPERTSTARLSADGLYRYSLTRTWGAGGDVATFIMLNPSTADATVNDPTIRRCIVFATSWGCSGLAVVNLYALRATDPKDLWKVADPVGPDNDQTIADFLFSSQSWPVVAAWGANAKPDRVSQVLALPGAANLRALGVTKDGAPRHPLYMRSDAQLSPWPSS